MQAAWKADNWLTIRDIRERMNYAPVAYTTVARVTEILHQKGLLVRHLDERPGKPGPSAWWYRPAQPMSEHIGELVARLLAYSPDPEATLGYALAKRVDCPGKSISTAPCQ